MLSLLVVSFDQIAETFAPSLRPHFRMIEHDAPMKKIMNKLYLNKFETLLGCCDLDHRGLSPGRAAMSRDTTDLIQALFILALDMVTLNEDLGVRGNDAVRAWICLYNLELHAPHASSH